MNTSHLSPITSPQGITGCYLANALTGLLTCLAISAFSGRPLAWDSSLYFSAGIPLMALVIYYSSYRAPRRPWRWALSMALGQALSVILAGVPLQSLPLALLILMVLSIPQFVAGVLGARLSRAHGMP